MRMDLRAACKECPFRTDQHYLSAERAEEISSVLLEGDGTFSCHKTLVEDEDGETVHGSKTQHCAGAMIFLMHQEMPNQLMRIALRMGWVKPEELDMDGPIYKTRMDFIRGHDQ